MKRTVFLTLCAMLCVLSLSVSACASDEQELYSRIVEVPGKGKMQYYAQNDPEWGNLCYEVRGSESHRQLKGGGCAPTSLSMALASITTEDTISQVLDLVPDGIYYFTSASVNPYWKKSKTENRTLLNTPELLRKYLPVLFAGYSTGYNSENAIYRTGVGNPSGMFVSVLSYFGYTEHFSSSLDDLKDCLQNGGMAIVSVGKGNIYTGGGHYMFIPSISNAP